MNLQDLWIAKCLKHNKTLHICQIHFDCLLEYSVLLTISTTNGVELCVASSCHCNKVDLHEGVTGKFGHLGFKVEIITFKNASAKVWKWSNSTLYLCECEGRIFFPVALLQPDLEDDPCVVNVGHVQGCLHAPRHVQAHEFHQSFHVVKHLASLRNCEYQRRTWK